MPLKTKSILTALGINFNEVDAKTQALLKSPMSLAELNELNILPITANMTVDERTMHPFGKLSGGASLALAECLAGYASRLLCSDNEFPTGIQVSANHTSTASKDEILLASANLVHKGVKTHIWNIDITSATGRLISSIRVTNMIITIKNKAS